MKPRQVKRISRPSANNLRATTARSQPRRKRRQIRLSIGRIGLIVAVLASLIVISWGGLIQSVEVENSPDPQRVAELVGDEIGGAWWQRNILFLPAKGLEETLLSKYPDQFSQIKISRDWLSRAVIVNVSERNAQLRWQTAQGDYGVDSQGVITGELGRGEAADMPLVIDSTNLDVKPGQQVAPARFITFVIQTRNLLDSQTKLKFVKGRITETTNELVVDTSQKYYLRLDTTRPASEQIVSLKALLADGIKPSSYVDLRLPHKAYYR